MSYLNANKSKELFVSYRERAHLWEAFNSFILLYDSFPTEKCDGVVGGVSNNLRRPAYVCTACQLKQNRRTTINKQKQTNKQKTNK